MEEKKKNSHKDRGGDEGGGGGGGLQLHKMEIGEGGWGGNSEARKQHSH